MIVKENKERIQQASRRLRFLLQIVFYCMPLINGVIWFYMNSLPVDLQNRILPHFVQMPLPIYTCVLGFVVVMIPTAIAMAGVQCLINLFRLYEKEVIFCQANVHCFKRLSRVLLWWFAASIVQRSLLTVVLTLHNPPGQRMISIDLSSTDLTALLLGGILAVIAWVMEEGRKLQEEQELTI